MAAPPLPSIRHYRRLFPVGCCLSPCEMAAVLCSIIIFAPLYYVLFSSCHQTSDFHLPDGRTASPFYPPLPPTVSGWLLCGSSSNGGCLMQYHHIIIALSWRHGEMWE